MFLYEGNLISSSGKVDINEINVCNVQDKENRLDKGFLNSFPKGDNLMQAILDIPLEDIFNTDVQDDENRLDKGYLNSFPKEDNLTQAVFDISDINLEDIINISDKGNCLDKGSLNSFSKEDSIFQDISDFNLEDVINTDVPDKGNCLDKGSLNNFPKEDNYLQTNSGISLEDVINTDVPDKGNCLDKGSLNNFPKEDSIMQDIYGGDNGGWSGQLSSDNKVVNANCQQTVEGLNSISDICPNNANVIENLLSKFPNPLSKNNTRKSNLLDIKNSSLKKTSPIQKSHSSKSMNCLKLKYLKKNHLYRNMKQKCLNNVINPIQYENGLLDNNYSKLNMNLLTQQLNLFSPSSIVASTSVAGYSPQQSILSVPTSMTSSFPPQFNSSITLSNVYSLLQQHSCSLLSRQPGIVNLQSIINNNKIISIKISDLSKGENENDKKNYNDNYIDLSKSELNLNIIGNPIIQYNETIDKDSALEILKKVIDFLKNYVDYNKSNNIKVNYKLKGIQYTDIEKMIKGEKDKNIKLLNQYNVMKCLGLDINNGLPIHKLLLTGSSKEWQVNTDSQVSSYMLKVQCGKMENLSEFSKKKIQKIVLEKINNKIRIKSNNDSWFLHIPIFYVHNRYYFNAPFYVNCEKRYKDYIEHIIKKNLSEKVFILNSIWDHNKDKICSNYDYNLEVYYKY